MAKKKASGKTPRKAAGGTRAKKPVSPRKSPTRTTAKPKTTARKASAKAPKANPASEIKKIDAEILKLINQRAKLTTDLILAEDDPQTVVFNNSADESTIAALAEQNCGPLSNETVRTIYRSVLNGARQNVKMNRVAYLGPKFSFTHLAAIERFGETADLIPVSTIATVFEEVNRGHTEFGLVPIENSTDGRVVDTLDMFTRLPLRICGEVQIAIHHNLLARCARSEITEIYSKPQALSQCRDWLARNMPNVRQIEVTSTSTAAQLARDKPGAAAVASRQASVQYGLQIVAEEIEDNSNNVTRFAVIGEGSPKPTGKDRTALLLRIPHKPGSLADSLSMFKKNKVNLTWIESFPIRGPKPGYLFFLDFEGHVQDAKVKKAISELEKATNKVEILGSYPRSINGT